MTMSDDTTASLRAALQATDEAIAELRKSRIAILAALGGDPVVGDPLDVDELRDGVAALGRKLDETPNDGSSDWYRVGTEIHGKLRRAKKDFDRLADSPEKVLLADELRAMTNRVLSEVFSVDPDVQAS